MQSISAFSAEDKTNARANGTKFTCLCKRTRHSLYVAFLVFRKKKVLAPIFSPPSLHQSTQYRDNRDQLCIHSRGTVKTTTVAQVFFSEMEGEEEETQRIRDIEK